MISRRTSQFLSVFTFRKQEKGFWKDTCHKRTNSSYRIPSTWRNFDKIRSQIHDPLVPKPRFLGSGSWKSEFPLTILNISQVLGVTSDYASHFPNTHTAPACVNVYALSYLTCTSATHALNLSLKLQAQVDLLPLCLGIRGQVKNGCHDGSWKLRSITGHGRTPPEGDTSHHRSGGNSTPPEKREPTYLSGGVSSTNSWWLPVGL
ncbi:hypothetical protein AVEN_48960-1 [Araneus ventricosus]|uniref:Uncharacterized protein n=1 Tax=Araneus ventricosus TaxID=182803 RepID=A0A4Y2AGL8_ARAVE|nr:hypothetical protein AVEN_48960-1 [Araneus ventricosus]